MEEIEDNLDIIVKFIHGKEDKYNKEVISVGIKSLFELGKISYWNKSIYFLYNTGSTGKSAGVSLLIAFYSAFFKIGIPNNLSATGEIDKEGNIKGIGGLKEKFLCVLWNKEADSLILPQENHEKVLKISDAYYKRFPKVLKKLKFSPVNHCKDLIDLLSQWGK